MGGTTSFYKSSDSSIFNKLTNPNVKKAKRDGTILRSKEQMI